jgi:hypothetical protein
MHAERGIKTGVNLPRNPSFPDAQKSFAVSVHKKRQSLAMVILRTQCVAGNCGIQFQTNLKINKMFDIIFKNILCF